MAYKVAVTDHVFPDLELEKKALAEIGATLEEYSCTSVDEIIDQVKDVDALLNCYAAVSAESIAKLVKCKIIARTGIGVDTINVEAAKKRNMFVTNVPDYCVDEVSDHSMALLLACARKVCQLNKTVHSGKWSLAEHKPMFRLRGQTMGFMGFGKIAQLLKSKAKPFGFKFIAYDPYLPKDVDPEVEMVDLNQLFERSDFISLHTPLTEKTRGMVNKSLFDLMKPTAFIINTARGPVVNEEDLIEALKEGKLGGAGLDVLKEETISLDDPILQFDNVIVTPHAAFYSEQSIVELRTKAVTQIIKVLKNEKPDYAL